MWSLDWELLNLPSSRLIEYWCWLFLVSHFVRPGCPVLHSVFPDPIRVILLAIGSNDIVELCHNLGFGLDFLFEVSSGSGFESL